LTDTETMAATRLIHVVEDDDGVRDALGLMLRVRGYAVRAHASALAFLEALPGAERGCIVTDVTMPGMTGLEMLKQLRADGVDWPAVVISGRATPQMSAEAKALTATAVLEKPFDPGEFLELVAEVTGGAR
jgi:two-component system response regulator FixJ